MPLPIGVGHPNTNYSNEVLLANFKGQDAAMGSVYNIVP